MLQMSAMRPGGAKPETGFSALRFFKPGRPDLMEVLKHLLWACMILAVAAYGAVVVRNVTDMLVGITHQPTTMVVTARPNR
jgi:hypothetical protein